MVDYQRYPRNFALGLICRIVPGSDNVYRGFKQQDVLSLSAIGFGILSITWRAIERPVNNSAGQRYFFRLVMKYSSLTGCRKSSDVSKSEDDTKSLHGGFYYFQTFHSYSCDGDGKKQDTLKIRAARKLHKRQPDAAHKELI